jgi:hypothetical protein
MASTVFPAPSAGGGAALPQGAVANVASGYAATGGWKYATSTAAGTYQVNIQAQSNQIYGIQTANGITKSDITGGSVIPLKTTATEASITIGSYHPYQVTTATTINGTVRHINGGNNLHIMTTSTGYIYTSTDSLTWTNRTSGGEGTSQSPYAPTYQNDRWIIPGWGAASSDTNGRGFLYSTDGITWTTKDLSAVHATRTVSVYYAGGLWVAICPNGATTNAIATSTNFTTFTGRTSPTTNAPYGMVYLNHEGTNYYIICCGGGVLFYSTDGTSWTNTGDITSGSRDLYTILSNGRTAIAFGSSGASTTVNATLSFLTPDGGGTPTNWNIVSIANNAVIGTTFVTGGYFLGTYILYCNANASTSTTNTLTDGVITTYRCVTSPDGFTWTLRSLPRNIRSSGNAQDQANGIVAYAITGKLYATTAYNSAAIHINSTALTSV